MIRGGQPWETQLPLARRTGSATGRRELEGNRYRAGADVAGDADDERVSATTGYFAHAVNPTTIVISAVTSTTDFSPESIAVALHSMAPRVCGAGLGVHAGCQTTNPRRIET
jgi:hypothetical protein